MGKRSKKEEREDGRFSHLGVWELLGEELVMQIEGSQPQPPASSQGPGAMGNGQVPPFFALPQATCYMKTEGTKPSLAQEALSSFHPRVFYWFRK